MTIRASKKTARLASVSSTSSGNALSRTLRAVNAVSLRLVRQLKLRPGPEVEITTASEVIAGYLLRLDELSIGPLTLRAPATP